MLYHHRRLADLDTDYDDCPEPCAESGEDLNSYCEACPIRQSFDEFREGCVEEITERYGEALLRQWSFAALHADLMRAFSSDRAVRGRGYPKNCSALEARLIDLIRFARIKAQRVERFNKEQERGGQT